jgi:hypothetical protein
MKKPHTLSSKAPIPARKPAKAKEEPEYRLLIAPHLAERTQQYVTRVILETTKAFASFRYELSVEEQIEEDSLRFTIVGFKAPGLSLPAAGPARFQKTYENLKGTFTLTVEGIDGRSNSFTVNIAPKKVELVKAPRQPFVLIETDASRWASQS